jgi:ATP-dependent Lon protease
MFVTTANFLYSIPEPLIDRLEIIPLSSYTEEEKVQITLRHIIPRLIREHGLADNSTPQFTEKIVRAIIRDYTREAGVRNVEKLIAKICRKIAKNIVEDEKRRTKEVNVTLKSIRRDLGPPKYQDDEKEQKDQIGIATGLAWTEVGGVLLPIEVATMPGKGNLTITGQLGDVMQESARAALSYIRAREKEFHLPKNFNEKLDLHIHVPEGAVPKDGPSAGIAIASAIFSALTREPVSANIAMTGEITLRGRVLPIGGLKEKVIAAHRAGIDTVLVPEENRRDTEEIPATVLGKVKLVFVQDMNEVLKAALRA